jgi:ABC-2 type transport system ATP-binding protein
MTYYTRKKLKTITGVTRSFYPAWDENAYRKYMKAFDLDEDKTPSSLSNGMKIKYALALALSHGAELMLLDEPTSGLDPISREELIEIFLSLRDEGKTILFSTHITADLEKCADRILYIRAGRLAADSAMDDFAGAYRIAAFDGEAPAEMKSAALGICRTRKGGTALLKKEDAAAICADWQIPTLDEIMTHLDREEAEDA